MWDVEGRGGPSLMEALGCSPGTGEALGMIPPLLEKLGDFSRVLGYHDSLGPGQVTPVLPV